MKWLAELKESGVNVKALDKVPEITPYGRWLWRAFHLLSDRRQLTADGPQPITISEIAAYADYFLIPSGSLRDDLLTCVTEMDNLFLQFVMKRRQEQRRKAEQKAKTGRPARSGRTNFPRPKRRRR